MAQFIYTFIKSDKNNFKSKLIIHAESKEDADNKVYDKGYCIPKPELNLIMSQSKYSSILERLRDEETVEELEA